MLYRYLVVFFSILLYSTKRERPLERHLRGLSQSENVLLLEPCENGLANDSTTLPPPHTRMKQYDDQNFGFVTAAD